MTTLDHPVDAPIVASPSVNDPSAEKRACIAAFMDLYPDVFAAPEAAPTWTEFVDQRCEPKGHDGMVLEQAIGRLVQQLRSAQESLPQQFDVRTMMERAKEEGLGDLAPDAAMMSLTPPDTPIEDAELMARAMTVYKDCISTGVANGSEIYDALEASFERLPADTPFMRDLIQTAKQIAMIDVRYTLETVG